MHGVAFESLPMPTLRDEAWRYTDISDVSADDFIPYAPSPDVERETDLPDAVQRLIHEGEENSALLVQHNSETTFQRVDERALAQGCRLYRSAHRAPRARGSDQETGSSGSCRMTTTSSLPLVRRVRRRVVPVRAAGRRCGVADPELPMARRGRCDDASHPRRRRRECERHLHRRVCLGRTMRTARLLQRGRRVVRRRGRESALRLVAELGAATCCISTPSVARPSKTRP